MVYKHNLSDLSGEYMLRNDDEDMPNREKVDYDVHGLVGIRLLDPAPSDRAAVANQLGPLEKPLLREPDITVRFVPSLSLRNLRYVTLSENGFTDDGFVVLRSKKQPAKVLMKFEQLGHTCEMICESGLRAIPLLLAILNLTLLRKNYISLHASAFTYRGKGILVTGWAKGGKTEALLSFFLNGATYVGDEWIVLSDDGEKMYGIPEKMRLWDWHLEYLPQIQCQVKYDQRLLFATIHWLDRLQMKLSKGRLRQVFPMPWWREAMPALKRQLNVTITPQVIFGSKFGSLVAKPEKVFLMMNHEAPHTYVEPTDPCEIARRMVASIQYEQQPLVEQYLAYRFAYPHTCNSLIEEMHELQYTTLSRALKGKTAYTVWHPYPVAIPELYRAMQPFCE